MKQLRHVWYNRLSGDLLKEDYKNNHIYSCVFIKKSITGFVNIAVYVDGLNKIGTREELPKTIDYLKNLFKITALGETWFYFKLQPSI